MRKVLIVSPHFPPVNAPDMQRARLALPYLRSLGWEPTVLAVTPESVEGAVIDDLLAETYPTDISVIRVAGISPRHTRWAGIGSLWWRCGTALRRAGDALLASEHFDLVFFTTTQFDVFTLGPHWRKRFGVPYVLDYQDPWVNDYYHRTGTRPPGGYVKFWLSQYTARHREPGVIRDMAALIAVSPSYGPDLLARYPSIDPGRLHVLPFGAAADDLEIARRHQPGKSLVPFGDGNQHFVYAGRCGPDMTLSLTLLFRAYYRYQQSHPSEAALMRFHSIGTDYAPPPLGRYWALPVAEQEGVAAHVAEHCYRVPYFDALYYLVNADALLAMGSNDPTYSASKIFPYLFARRPLITIVHQGSLMLRIVHEQGILSSYGFDIDKDIEATVLRIHQEWFVQKGYLTTPSGNLDLLKSHTAFSMSTRLAAVFDEIGRE